MTFSSCVIVAAAFVVVVVVVCVDCGLCVRYLGRMVDALAC